VKTLRAVRNINRTPKAVIAKIQIYWPDAYATQIFSLHYRHGALIMSLILLQLYCRISNISTVNYLTCTSTWQYLMETLYA